MYLMFVFACKDRLPRPKFPNFAPLFQRTACFALRKERETAQSPRGHALLNLCRTQRYEWPSCPPYTIGSAYFAFPGTFSFKNIGGYGKFFVTLQLGCAEMGKAAVVAPRGSGRKHNNN